MDRAGGRGLHDDVDLVLGGACEADPVGRGRGEAAEDAESAGEEPALAQVPHRGHRPRRARLRQLPQQVRERLHVRSGGGGGGGPEPTPQPQCELEMMKGLLLFFHHPR